MKKLTGMILAIMFIVGSGFTMAAYADGCYICKEGGLVIFRDKDDQRKRNEAKKQFKCTVSGLKTSGSCAKAKGTVK